MTTTAPGGRCRAYWAYLAASRSSARSRSGPDSTTRPAPSTRTHHRRAHSSSYWSTGGPARAWARTLLSRRSAAVVLGLASTAETTRSPSSTKQHGTTCGPPPAVTVASRPTRASATRRRIVASSITPHRTGPIRPHAGVRKSLVYQPTARQHLQSPERYSDPLKEVPHDPTARAPLRGDSRGPPGRDRHCGFALNPAPARAFRSPVALRPPAPSPGATP